MSSLVAKRFCIALSLLAVAFATACTGQYTRGPALIDPVVASLQGAFVTFGNVEEKQVRQGLVRIPSETVVLEGASGHFGTFYVSSGDSVAQGQVLARMDVTQLQNQIENQEELIANLAQQQYMERQGLLLDVIALELNGAGRASIEFAQLAYAHATQRQELDMQDAQRRLDELMDAFAGSTITAPFDGIIVALSNVENSWVNRLDPVLYIASPQMYQDVFVEYIGQRMNHHQARCRVRVTAHANGQVFELTPLSLTSTQQFYYTRQDLLLPIRYQFESGESLPAGTPAAIHLYTVWYQDVLRVPQNAIFFDIYGNNYVYRLIDGAMVQTFVTSGSITTTYVAIFDGLQEGDEVFVRL